MPDADVRGVALGLTRELRDCFVAQLDVDKETKGRFCQAQGFCADAESFTDEASNLSPLHPKVEICANCGDPRYVHVPAHLIEAAQTASRLSRLKDYGYALTVELSPFEWTCIEAIETARAIGEKPDAAEQNRAQFEASANAYHARMSRGNG